MCRMETIIIQCDCINDIFSEPDRFFAVAPDIPVSPQQDARDFKTLKALVDDKSPTTKFIAGPDVADVSNPFFGEYVVFGDDFFC